MSEERDEALAVADRLMHDYRPMSRLIIRRLLAIAYLMGKNVATIETAGLIAKELDDNDK